MELVKKNIHTERIKAKALLQIPLEEDINVSDTRPDVGKLVFTRGKIKIDEMKTGTNKVWAKGRLGFQILYLAEGKEAGLAGMEGELPFMEEIYMDMVENGDRVICETDLEDMRVNMINSRKLSIQAVITLMPRVEETVEEEVCTELTGQIGSVQNMGNEQLEYRRKALDYLETAVCKRDLLRIHEENKLPSGMPSIGTVLWKSASVSHMNFRPLAGKLAAAGEISLFVVYTEDNTNKTNWYETTIPFSGNVECQGCEENMVADISYEAGHEEITVREDADGETRNIGIEMALELELKLLNRESMPIVADVYGVSCEVEAVTNPKQFKKLIQDVYFEEKLGNTVKIEDNDAKILQICHTDSRLEIENCIFQENELECKGILHLRILYLTSGEESGFSTVEDSFPFTVTRSISGLRPDMEYTSESCSLHPQIEQLHVTMKEGNRVEWNAVLGLQILVYDIQQEEILSELKVGELDSRKLEKLPGFAIYYVKEGDSLWQIGKKYYVSVEKIKEVNQLSSEEIKAGDRLLIVKSGEI